MKLEFTGSFTPPVRREGKKAVTKWWALPSGLPPVASKRALPVKPPLLPPSNPSTHDDWEKAGRERRAAEKADGIQ
jgi:hypothetical protein